MSTQADHNPTQDVFEHVLARPVASHDLFQGRLVHLSWRAPEQGDRLVQFYANGQWIGHSTSPGDREAWIVLPHDRHTQIELLATPTADAARPMPGLLAASRPETSPAAAFTFLRDTALPIDGVVSVEHDGQFWPDHSPLFASDVSRGGFGAVFGEGGFGFDASTGPGLGLGELGYGPLGADGTALRWRSDTMPKGSNDISVSLRDSEGRSVMPPVEVGIEIDRLPLPPTDISLGSDLTLTWT